MTIKIPRRIAGGLSRRRFLSTRGGDRRRRAWRHRDALSQPRSRPAADHPRRAVRRCRRRRRRGVGARRPAVADAGRGRHHRIVSAMRGHCRRSRHSPRATSPQRCCWRICPPGRIFFIASDSATCRIPTFPASQSSAASAPPRLTGAMSVSSGAAMSRDRAGVSIPTTAACVTFATMRKHRPDFLIHSGDTIYADGVISCRGEIA